MPEALRIVFCWSDISGYMAACWKALAAHPEVDLRIYAFGNNDETNFNPELTKGLDILWVDRSPDQKKLEEEVCEYAPDVIVLCGWFVPAYRKLPSSNKLKLTKFVLAMDTPWWGTLRQQLGRFALRGFIQKMDAVLTSGERSYQYARRLRAKNIYKFQYGVDVDRLSLNLKARRQKPWPKRFLYVGRYAPEKGIPLLMEAYREYRNQSEDPWELQACGKGLLEHLVKGDGVTNHGFVQPDEMDKTWQSSGCLILPSTFDPWPLIVVEACAAGLPVIVTHESGSQVEVVKTFWNGLVIPANDEKSLMEALLWIEKHHDRLPEMGKLALTQARPFAADAWADKLSDLIATL
ncbi:MAG: glycosyltransferase family 4 protein [Cyclobacteriaceae bacterium]